MSGISKGEEIDQGNQQNDFPQDSQKERSFGVAQCHKGLLAGNLHAENSGSRHIDPQCPGGILHQLRAAVEHQNKHAREQLHQSPQKQRVCYAGPQQTAKGRPHSLRIPGPVVIADNGLRALGQSLQGHHGKLHDAGEHRHGADGNVPAIPVQ